MSWESLKAATAAALEKWKTGRRVRPVGAGRRKWKRERYRAKKERAKARRLAKRRRRLAAELGIDPASLDG